MNLNIFGQQSQKLLLHAARSSEAPKGVPSSKVKKLDVDFPKHVEF